jgi:hypothetical protein
MNLSRNNIVVGIWLLVTFGFLVMLHSMSLVHSSMMFTLMSLLIGHICRLRRSLCGLKQAPQLSLLLGLLLVNMILPFSFTPPVVVS